MTRNASPAPDDAALSKRQLLLHLDAGLIKDLKKAAVDLDTSASALANQAIDAWLRAKGLRAGEGKGDASE
jgi:hypothetical protein